MDVETELGHDEVTISVDGESVGTLPREFYEEWSQRIENDPESCLSACLAERATGQVN